ncbi:MAG: hypothetical protein P9L96_04545 [Candidatus Gygaella obscura]|nr:hypothetical protein [Candidatus Gygaella obscura]
MGNDSLDKEARTNESKEAKFKRLADKRVNAALQKIGLLGNLANPSYSYSSEQVEKIIVALTASVAEVEEKFQKVLDRNRKKFEL